MQPHEGEAESGMEGPDKEHLRKVAALPVRPSGSCDEPNDLVLLPGVTPFFEERRRVLGDEAGGSENRRLTAPRR